MSPAEMPLNADKFSNLIKMSKAGSHPNGWCRLLILRDLSKRIRHITALLRNGVTFEFTPAREVIGSEISDKLAFPHTLVFPDWQAVANALRSFDE